MSKIIYMFCVSRFLYGFFFYYSVLWKVRGDFYVWVRVAWGVNGLDDNISLEIEDIVSFLGFLNIMG